MAKRFIDNTIFDKQWFRELEPRLKLAWFYLISKCNHAGIWESDISLMSFQVGQEYTIEDLFQAFGDNIIKLEEDKFYLPKFIEFQYGVPLNPNVKVHKSVIKLLNKYDKGLTKSLEGVKGEPKPSVSLEDRKQKFAKLVEEETSGQDGVYPDLLSAFINYWTEHNSNGAKMRFEQHNIFNIKQRMRTFVRNDKNSFKSKSGYEQEDLQKKEKRIEKEYQKQVNRFKNITPATDNERKKALGLE